MGGPLWAAEREWIWVGIKRRRRWFGRGEGDGILRLARCRPEEDIGGVGYGPVVSSVALINGGWW